MTEYVPPEWGKEGKNLFDIFIDVIKGGIVVENLKLPFDKNKSYVVAGMLHLHLNRKRKKSDVYLF
jgi:hypothetical protein